MRRAVLLLCSVALIAGVSAPAASAAKGKGNGNGPPPRVVMNQAERECEKRGGIFVQVDGLVFVCLLHGSDSRPGNKPHKLERNCERRGGTFIDLDGIAEICLFPGGELTDLDPGLLEDLFPNGVPARL